MLVTVLFSLLVISVFASEDSEEARQRRTQQVWENFKIAHGKSYATQAEHDMRRAIFAANHKFISEFPRDKRGFTVSHNEFSDLTNQEFRARFNGLNITKNVNSRAARSPRLTLKKAIPTSWDWRTRGAVTGIKNQGQCGSCWSFSATGSMEGAWFLTKGNLVSLSEQNLIDCSVAQGNEGCNGGLMDQAFQYVITNGGIDTEASYPYTATGPNTCQYNAANSAATMSSFKDVVSGSESGLLTAVYATPTSVAIDASQQSFQFYSGGVYNEPACSSTQLDHGVLAVGFGMYQDTTAYWLVKNSWGTSWGLNGYIMMSRNLNNQCGIATAASYPIV
jgi:cathepsin L